MEEEIGPKKEFHFNFKELWEYRELFYFFTWRDVKVKYKQTFLGVIWAVIQPLAMAIILNFSVGNNISKNNHLPIPYLVFVFSGFILWTVFSGGLTNAANSMVSNANIIKKIYFPRLVIPLSAVLSNVFDFVFALLVFFALSFIYSVPLSVWAFLCIPVGLLLTVFAALGMGVLLSALNIKYRDFRYAVPFLIQGLLFLTPVIYPINISGNAVINFILKCNPVAAGLEIFKGSYANYPINPSVIYYSLFCNVFIFLAGIYYFRKTESYFADLA
jgi:lipopolysaccharide transport system permease protein